ncbi:MAG: hypothetical protein AB7I57_18365 [Pirellulales bacterium]
MARPKGSKTQKHPVLKVVQIPTRCHVCGSEKLTPTPGYEWGVTEGGGVTADGREFVRVRRRLHHCECGQRFVVMYQDLVDDAGDGESEEKTISDS